MAEVFRQTALEDRAFAAPGISLVPATPAERISLRAEGNAVKSVSDALGITLPAKPKTSTSSEGLLALWLGPDEWLLIGPQGADLNAKLSKLNPGELSVVDISHRNTAIIASGPRVETVFNSGCPQDLSMDAFPVGACARTVLAKSEIILYREATDRFRVECWRSFSDYVWTFLADAAKSA